MKKLFFVGLLVFSLLANISAGVVIARHWWQTPTNFETQLSKECPIISNDDIKKMSPIWSRKAKQGIIRTRQELIAKRAQVLELIAKNPGDLKPVENDIKEMIELRGSLENQILEKVSKTMATLPPEKRQAFLEFLKHRTCRMMGRGRGRGFGKGCPPCCPGADGPPCN
ncbi:MAG: periplasmic heavy metal sensor [Desulfomonilaceae bacterium]